MKDKPALYQYLDDLLHEPDAGQDAGRKTGSKVLYPKHFLAPPDATDDAGKVEPATQSLENQQQENAVQLERSEAEQWDERPHWAQQPFECLVFSVSGLTFAVPLVSLGSIHTIDRKLTPLPGQPEWFLGIMHTNATGNLKVLDTARCVMPERYKAEDRNGLHYVISIHGSDWGLACHSVEKSVTLQPDKVKWRQQRSKRPWLAGTVVDLMCSLLDTDGFQDFIEHPV